MRIYLVTVVIREGLVPYGRGRRKRRGEHGTVTGKRVVNPRIY